jgi:hypothetical protein
MKFSLNDMMWTVTFACVGLGCLVLAIPPQNAIEAALIFAGLALFGAAIGRLFHLTWYFSVTGVIVCLLVLAFALMLLPFPR